MVFINHYEVALKLNLLLLFIKYVILVIYFNKRRESVYYEPNQVYFICFFVELVCSLIPLFNVGYLIFNGGRLLYIITNFNKTNR